MNRLSGWFHLPGTEWCVRKGKTFSIVIVFLASSIPALANPIFDGWAVSIDGVFTSFNQLGPSDATAFPAAVDTSQFDAGTLDPPNGSPGAGTGLGTLTVSIQGAGNHLVMIWLDLHLDNEGPVYWDEFGSTRGTPGVNQTWQIDEPGYGTLGYTGDIFSRVQNSTPGTGSLLTNSNALPANGLNSPNDTSLALGQAFTLTAHQRALWTISSGLTSDPATLPPQFFYCKAALMSRAPSTCPAVFLW